MRLQLPIPDDWIPEQRGAFVSYTTPRLPGLRVLVSPLMPLPEDPAGWSRQQFVNAVPPGTPVRISLSTELRTVDGWPALLTEGVIGDEPAGSSAEARLVLQYRFLEHVAAAIVRCQDPSAYAPVRDGLVELLCRGRPDWSEQPILSLAQLFDGVIKPAPGSMPGDD
jgi:hypothetical protein